MLPQSFWIVSVKLKLQREISQVFSDCMFLESLNLCENPPMCQYSRRLRLAMHHSPSSIKRRHGAVLCVLLTLSSRPARLIMQEKGLLDELTPMRLMCVNKQKQTADLILSRRNIIKLNECLTGQEASTSTSTLLCMFVCVLVLRPEDVNNGWEVCVMMPVGGLICIFVCLCMFAYVCPCFFMAVQRCVYKNKTLQCMSCGVRLCAAGLSMHTLGLRNSKQSILFKQEVLQIHSAHALVGTLFKDLWYLPRAILPIDRDWYPEGATRHVLVRFLCSIKPQMFRMWPWMSQVTREFSASANYCTFQTHCVFLSVFHCSHKTIVRNLCCTDAMRMMPYWTQKFFRFLKNLQEDLAIFPRCLSVSTRRELSCQHKAKPPRPHSLTFSAHGQIFEVS